MLATSSMRQAARLRALHSRLESVVLVPVPAARFHAVAKPAAWSQFVRPQQFPAARQASGRWLSTTSNKKAFAEPGRPGPGRGPPIKHGTRGNAANFIAAALIAATFGWTGWMYQQKTGPFKFAKTEEELKAEAAADAAKLEWLKTKDPINATVTDRVYFDIAINGTLRGRVVLDLFGEVAPKTVANFLALAQPAVGVPAPATTGSCLLYTSPSPRDRG